MTVLQKMGACLGGVATTAALLVGCDPLNKPIRPLHHPPPAQTTTGVEGADAGDPPDGDASVPLITPQPDDIHL